MTERSANVHQVKVIDLGDGGEPVWICSCGTASPPYPTKEDALRWAHGHSPNVAEEVEVWREEGGVGWMCMFCGSVIEEAPLRVFVHWTDEGVDDEQ
jgi:hypothetical protein